MTPVAAAPPTSLSMAAIRKFSVSEYQRLIDVGVLTDEDRVELLENYLVLKMPANPPHDSTVTKLYRRLDRLAPPGYLARCQVGSSLPDSRPEPDIALVRDEASFDARHPAPHEIALVVEVADSSLPRDRVDKGRIYARVSIPQYWVVNLVDRQIEVFTDPTGPASVPVYRRRQDFTPGISVPVELDGRSVGAVSVDEVLP
ncbi:MAG: Uma2 family endonuclease [Fimbriiglobus sp.]|nr:Uma2 family endonuclease [Fimbriiglobus sp.]